MKIDNYFYWIQKSGAYLPQIFATEYDVQGWDQYTTAGMMGEMPQVIGLSITIVLIVAVIWLVVNKSKKKEIWLAFGLVCLSMFMASNLFPYDWLCYHIPLLKPFIVSLQFPWRFFSVTSALTCWLFVLILQVWKYEYGRKAVGVFMIGICLIGTLQGLSFMSKVLNEKSLLKD